MAKLFLAICFFLFSDVRQDENVYTHSVISIEGVNKSLSTYQGKKLLILSLPIQQNSSSDSLLHSLDSLGTAYNNSLVIIAVPSYEDGYTSAIKENLKQWYRSILSMDIIVTDGMYTRKTSGNLQHPLFKWLTDKDKNGHFNQDVVGPGDKFLVWTNGVLTGVLGSHTRIGSNIIHSLLQAE